MKRTIVFSISLLLCVLFLVSGCKKTPYKEVNLSPENWLEGELEKYTKLNQIYGQPKLVAESSKGMISGAIEPLSIHAGLLALKQGGSAADAVMTTAIAQICQAIGSYVSYAGFMTMVYYDALTGKVHSMNAAYNTVYEEDDPLSIPALGTPSGRTALVPGFFAGVQAAHDRFGKIPFGQLFEPAIYFAEKGFILKPFMANAIQNRQDVLSRLPETRQIFTKENGEFYQEGDLFKQPQLTETLRQVASQGADYIYKGKWARKFVNAVRKESGKIMLKDMENYRVIWSEPLQTTYGEYQVYGMDLPNYGGVNTLEALNLLELADLAKLGHYETVPEVLYWFIQIARVSGYLGPSESGPGFGLPVPPELVKKHFPEGDLSLQSRVKKDTSKLIWKKMHEPGWAELKREVLDWSIKATAHIWEGIEKDLKPRRHSACIVAVDEWGNVAAIVHTINTINWGTTGIFVDGISIPDSACFQQLLIKEVGPGARLPDPTNPLIVLKDGKPMLASSAIGVGLHEVTLQSVINVLDFGMDPQAAIDAPQFFRPPWSPYEFGMQCIGEGFSEDVLNAIINMGQEAKISPEGIGYWVGIKINLTTGKLQGGVSKHFNGLAEGY